jgi:hypothetical protein
MDFEKTRDTRPAAPATRSPVARVLWTALAVALTAVLLPAAISLASTGSLATYSVVGAITGAKPKSEQDEAPRKAAAPEKREPAPVADDASDEPLAVLSDTSDVVKDRSDDKRRKGDDSKRRSSDDGDKRRGRDDKDLSRAHRPSDKPAKDDGADEQPDDSPNGTDDEATSAPTAPVVEDKPRVDEPTPHRAPVPAPVRTRPATVTPATPVAPVDDTTTGPSDVTVPVPADDGSQPTDEPTDSSDDRRRFVLAAGESVTLVVDMPETDDVLTLWARGAVSGCAPQLAVLVDRELYGMVDLQGSDWLDHAIEPAPEAGIHSVRLVAIGADDTTQCTGDPDQDRLTIVEPKAGEAGKVPPLGAVDAVAPTDPATDSTGTAVDGSGDSTGTAVDGSGDSTVAPTDTPTDAPVDTTGSTDSSTVDGTSTDSSVSPESSSLDGASGDSTDTTTAPTDQSTTDPVTVDPSTVAAVDARRQFVLHRNESVSLNVNGSAESALILWARASNGECAPDVAVSLDRRHVDVIEVSGTDWQQHTLEDVHDGDVHNVRLGFADVNGGHRCSTDGSTDTVTLVEPTTGDTGAAEPTTIVPTDPGTSTGSPTNGAPTEGAPTAGSGKATLLWAGDFEDALSDFGDAPWNYQGAPTPAAVTVGSSKVGKFDVPAGVGRSELVGTGAANTLSNGQVRYFAWSTYLPADFAFSPKWRILTQWKNAGTGSPPLELKLIGDQWHLDGGWNGGSCAEGSDQRTAWTGTAARGRWTNFVAGIKFQEGSDGNPYAGWVELWQDGKPVLQRTPWKTLYRGCSSYLKLGLYRDPSIGTHDVVYHDNWKMGTSYDSVAQ